MAPLAKLSRLAADLNSMTGGQASYSMDFSHYDVVPGNVQQQIVAKSTSIANLKDGQTKSGLNRATGRSPAAPPPEPSAEYKLGAGI